jgi:hypothetical protein
VREDPFGTLVAITIALMAVLLATAITMWAMDATAKRNAYEQCVADIPGYLDAQEILYQERECKNGVAP